MRDWSYAISWERESSPLARGQLYRGVAELRPRRIIPARAGFTKPSASAKSVTTDHPRACGVYVMLPSVMVRTGGSSPRVRGLRHPGAAEQLDGGIIPARAGFTQRLVQRAVWRGDHPRACGVYAPVAPRRWYAAGSSPHARGLLPLAVLLDGAVGIIPARAGFTVGRS